MKRFALILIVAFAATLVRTPQLEAYNLYGGSWPWTSIGYCITTSYSDHDFRWALAANNWNNATSTIHFYEDCSGNDSGLLDVNYSGVGWAGLATLSPCTSCTYSAGWGYMNYYYTGGYSPQDRTTVAGHELGHLLGLDHSSATAIMNSSPWGITSPQTDDVNGIDAIY